MSDDVLASLSSCGVTAGARLAALTNSPLNDAEATSEQSSFLEANGLDLLSRWLSDGVNVLRSGDAAASVEAVELLSLILDILRNLDIDIDRLNDQRERAVASSASFPPIADAVRAIQSVSLPSTSASSIQLSSACDNLLEHWDGLSAEAEAERAEEARGQLATKSKFDLLASAKEKIDTVITHHSNIAGEATSERLEHDARAVVPGVAIVKLDAPNKKGAASEAAEAAAAAAAAAEETAGALPADGSTNRKKKRKIKGGIRWADETPEDAAARGSLSPTSPSNTPTKFPRISASSSSSSSSPGTSSNGLTTMSGIL